MAKRGKTHLSNDHWIEQEGVTWEQSDSAEDFSPHIPKGEFDLRIRKAKKLLAKYGIADRYIAALFGRDDATPIRLDPSS